MHNLPNYIIVLTSVYSLAEQAKLVDDHTIDHRAGRVDESEGAAEKCLSINFVIYLKLYLYYIFM